MKLLLAVIATAAALGAPLLRGAEPAKPNILFIMADDLNDWVGFLGGHPQTRTPNLDRLAARGVVFANAACASPLCAPSRAAISAGASRIAPVPTATRTGAESFDWGPLDVSDDEMGDGQIATWAAARLRQPSRQPFFLGVGFYRPHIPLWAPTRYFKPFPVASIQLPPYLAADLDDLSPAGRRVAIDAVTAGAHDSVVKYRQWQSAVAAYLACVHFVDAQVGKVLDALDAGPHANNTIIVFMGDHGWHLGEKNHWGKLTGWERSVRVPLAIVPAKRDAARFAAQQSSTQPVSLIDLYPTLVDYAGLPKPASALDGTSLVPLLRAPAARTGRVVVTTVDGVHYSMRDERWRYLRYNDGSEELYDLKTDPNEWKNVATQPEHAATKARLATAIPQDPMRVVAPNAAKKKKKSP